MLAPHAFRRTVPWLRSISAARPSLGSSRSSRGHGIEGCKLRIFPDVCAHKIGGLDLSAGQGHGLENPLVPECRFLIGLFHPGATILCDVLARVPVPFSHRIMSFRNPDRRVELMKARLRTTSLPKRTTKNRYSRLSLLVHAGTSQDGRHQRVNDWKVSERGSGRRWSNWLDSETAL